MTFFLSRAVGPSDKTDALQIPKWRGGTECLYSSLVCQLLFFLGAVQLIPFFHPNIFPFPPLYNNVSVKVESSNKADKEHINDSTYLYDSCDYQDGEATRFNENKAGVARL